MQDVIFNGTDGRKPLGMAEVNITFADCEGVLQTEYNEVTVSRRVFRTQAGACEGTRIRSVESRGLCA